MDIIRYAGRRLLQTIPVLIGITLVAFFMLRLIPGDPAAQMLGTRAATQENIATVRHQLGLDEPLHAQYLHFVEGIVRGDLGDSFFYKQPVLPLVMERVPVSVGQSRSRRTWRAVAPTSNSARAFASLAVFT